jgi:hypothetical protein
MKSLSGYKTYVAAAAFGVVGVLVALDVLTQDQAAGALVAIGGVLGITFRHAIQKLEAKKD